MKGDVLLSASESICPECFKTVKAEKLLRGEDVFLRKECLEHGRFEVPLWRGSPFYGFWRRPKIPSYPKAPFTAVEKGCPWDCGLCSEHRQHTCTALIEVTQRCNLHCPYCFADSGGSRRGDLDIGAIRSCFERLLEAGGPYNVQLSGGEPTLRDDLPEIISMGRALGFSFIQVNTNGLRIAASPDYAEALRDAGAASVFLQFDGLEDSAYEKLRGRPLSREKRLAVEHCAERGLGVILVPTLAPGVNVREIGAIIRFAVEHMPAVRGVHFQPVGYFGRYPSAPAEDARITIPEVIREIEAQTEGKIKAEHFQPPGCENAFCSFHGNFILLPDGNLKAWSSRDSGSCRPRPEQAEIGAAKARSFVSRFWSQAPRCEESKPGMSITGLDDFLVRAGTHTLCISGMAFQDAWNLDLERLKDCCIHVMAPDGRLVPFCAYNLTDSRGRAFYRS